MSCKDSANEWKARRRLLDFYGVLPCVVCLVAEGFLIGESMTESRRGLTRLADRLMKIMAVVVNGSFTA